jgi:hypothetical protein
MRLSRSRHSPFVAIAALVLALGPLGGTPLPTQQNAAGQAAQRTAAKPGATPRVLSLSPAHEDVEVDSAKVRELVVRFDQDMQTQGYSFCGGGPSFPKTRGAAQWTDPRTCVLPVELVPGQSYRMALNCPNSSSFRSKAGVPLRSTPWSFSTLPAKLLPPSVQRKLNRDASTELAKLLRDEYSYYEHRGIDWRKLFAEHQDMLEDPRTTRGWAAAVGRMLSITGDLHLYLRLGDQVFATGRRSVDSLYRARRLGRYFATLKQDPKGVLIGLTRDGIGYLMISSWSSQIDFDRVEALLAKINPTRGLILDVRPNSGGDERLAMRVARHFIEGSKVYAKHAQRMGPGKFGKAIERRIDGIGKSILAGPGQSEWTDVPVAVLMSGYCMSSCEAFLLMMRQAKSAVLVGQRSQGSSGNPKPHELANGVTIYVPSWKALRPDGTCFEGEGIRPDIEVVGLAPGVEKRQSAPGVETALLPDEDSLRRGVATK